VVLRPGVRLYGGFTGSEVGRDERDWAAHGTIIDGSTSLLGSAPAHHVVVGTDDATLDGFTITGGSARGGDERNNGGGMYNRNVSPSVTNCTFSGNSADSYGGGMYNEDGSPTMTNCTFSNNSAEGGGAMYNYIGSPTITDCMFSNNSADTYGGAMRKYIGSPTITNCTFSNNSADWYGGAMRNDIGSPTMTNCTFSKNSAGYDGGGAMSNWRGSQAVTNCTFSNNSANYGGAMVNSNDGSGVTNCTFYGNTASRGGGAVRNEASSDIFLRNCVLWENGDQISNEDSSYGFVQYSDVQGGYAGTGNIAADPLFMDAAHGDLRLQADSLCVDAGTTTDAPETDIRGVSRPQGAGVDMGAYEVLEDEAITILLPGDVPLEMVWIPAGTFIMGRYGDEQDSYSSEDPQHQVTLTHRFWMGKYEVTQAQWVAVMGTNPSVFQGGSYGNTDNRPVEQALWNDAGQF